jgi:hypothetical protein
MGDGWSTPRPDRYTTGKDSGIHCKGGWVGPRDGLDGCRKSRPPPGFDPRTVQSVASRYTACAIAAYSYRRHMKFTSIRQCKNSLSEAYDVWVIAETSRISNIPRQTSDNELNVLNVNVVQLINQYNKLLCREVHI